MRPLALAVGWFLVLVPTAVAQAPEPGAYRENDAGGFRDVLPPGTKGVANAAELGAFLATGARPRHNDDQLGMYAELGRVAPGVQPSELDRFFKDASFGVRPEDVASRHSPRGDVTIVRDRGFGVPHVYGRTRDGAMFGLGYAAAEDRLFLMDVLRNVGRGRLSSFAGGARGNREFDAEQWSVAPYDEADLQRQVDQFDDLYGPDGAQVQRDAENYVAGVNAYIAEARLNPLKMPGEYAAFGKAEGPDPWRTTDIIATAALVGGIFGKGGGTELQDALLRQTFEKRFGARRGERLWRSFASFEDPEAPTTVQGRRFPYGVSPSRPRGLAMPDRGTVVEEQTVTEQQGSAAQAGARSGGGPLALDRVPLPQTSSNALLVSRSQTRSGRPIAVFGPQTGYFSPQLLMEQDVHAPASAAGPGIDARGAAFAGTNLYVQLGRGRDYAWSATSAGQDIIDTYAVDLCEPGGGQPTLQSTHYVFGGECLPFEELRRRNCWEPNAADATPAGCETLVARRSRLGLVTARARFRGRPVAYTKLRRTYFHEIDSAFGFMDLNDPARIRDVGDFQRAAHKIQYTFNWFYVDSRDIGYYNSGANPVRPPRVDPNLPTLGRDPYLWRGFDPAQNTADITPMSEHPQAVNQPFLTDWNNKQARGYRGAGFGSFQSVHRVDLLHKRVRYGTHGPRRMSLTDLVNAMGDAGTADLRGQEVLPWALRVIEIPNRRTPLDGALAGAVNRLRAWARSGAHRRDRQGSGTYQHAEAIRLMDAWWPRMLRAVFEPRMGPELFTAMRDRVAHDDPNRTNHLGSAFQGGWYGWLEKDLRSVLGRRVRGEYAMRFCGGGSRTRCRAVLLASLREAMNVAPERVYPADSVCPDEDIPDRQKCADAIRHTPGGGITQPLVPFQNRPTYQQVVEIPGRAPR